MSVLTRRHSVDNGSEFLNHAVIDWSVDLKIFFTRSRPYKKNDQATIESKNNHLVCKYGFYYRYDTDAELRVLNRLWRLVNDRFNYLTPTKKPIGFASNVNGKRKRLYDTPKTPLDRLLAAHVLSPEQEGSRTTCLPRLAEPRSDRPPDRRAAGHAPQTRQGQDRAVVPRLVPQHPARYPQRHPSQSQLNRRHFRGHS